MCPTCSLNLHASCSLRVLVPHVPCALRALEADIRRALRALVNHLPFTLHALLPHVLRASSVLCSRYHMSHVTRALLAV